jgi:hypothetical protein
VKEQGEVKAWKCSHSLGNVLELGGWIEDYYKKVVVCCQIEKVQYVFPTPLKSRKRIHKDDRTFLLLLNSIQVLLKVWCISGLEWSFEDPNGNMETFTIKQSPVDLTINF